jgi:hypothetical protein
MFGEMATGNVCRFDQVMTSIFGDFIAMRRDLNHLFLLLAAWFMSLMVAAPSLAVVVFSEDFEGLTLGPNVDESLANPNAFTHTPPVGWNIMNNLPIDDDENDVGVTEWRGWSFTDAGWWSATTGDQQRSQFTNASGTVAVADPDEWDDLGDPRPESLGTYNTFLSTGPISLVGINAGALRLRFDSSWRDEDNQRVNITVSYDGGSANEILRWTSTAGSDFHDDAPNEFIDLALNNPVDASSAVITWGMEDAGNDWWWAIDNISVEAPAPLTLRVDPASGEMELRGNLDLADLTGYEITSPSGSLDVAGWQAGNLAAQNIDPIGAGPGESWESLFFNSSQLAETFLLGSSQFDSTRVESLGTGYNPGGTPDLVFEFSQPDGSITPVDVEYATIYQDADFNENGAVDGDDRAIWEDGFGQFGGNAAKADGDVDGDGFVAGNDFLEWQRQLDSGGNLIASVPEPSTWALCGLALLGLTVISTRH